MYLPDDEVGLGATHLGQYVEAAMAAVNVASALIGKKKARPAPIMIAPPPPPPPPPSLPPPRPSTPGWVWPVVGVTAVGGAVAVGMLMGGGRRQR